LQGAHWGAVVTELGVVVILKDKAAARARPGKQLSSPVTAQDGTGGELMRRRHQHRIGVQPGDDHPVGVNRLADEVEAERPDALMVCGV